MKKILLSLAVALLGLSAQAQNQEFAVDGTAPAETKTVYYCVNQNFRQMDSTKVDAGKFQIKVSAPKDAFLYIVGQQSSVFALLDGQPVSVELIGKGVGNVKGSELNSRLNAFYKQQGAGYAKQGELYKEYREIAKDETKAARKAELEAQIQKLGDEQEAASKAFIAANKDNVLPAYALGDIYYGMSYDELKAMFDSNAPFVSHPLAARAKSHMEALAKRRPGLAYTELTMKDLDDKDVRLSQYVGKGYLLVDFWASWCGPCRAEMPTVVKAYETYKGKGFNVVGVSFDSKADAWKKAVQDLHMAWPQMSDLKGWKCAAADAYGVNAIPSNVLLDKAGKIVAVDLRGEALLNKLAELYK